MLPAGWLPSPVYGRWGWGRGRAGNCRQCHTVTKCSIIYWAGKKIRHSREGGNPASFSAKSLGLRPRLTACRGRLRGDDECLIFSHLILELLIEKPLGGCWVDN